MLFALSANDVCFAHDVACGNDACLRHVIGKHRIMDRAAIHIISEHSEESTNVHENEVQYDK